MQSYSSKHEYMEESQDKLTLLQHDGNDTLTPCNLSPTVAPGPGQRFTFSSQPSKMLLRSRCSGYIHRSLPALQEFSQDTSCG
jgi:hypothetical protein